jgi:hypothetical protein
MKRVYWLVVVALILLGTIFQSLTMFRSGQTYEYGIGYWGPTARDGVWHQALVESLKREVPPENPGLSGTILTNYHYYYDLLVAKTTMVTRIPSLDLIYRIYPIIFSILFGIGTYILSGMLFKSKIASLFSLFFVYFGSSFGWVVEFIRERHFGGESAFWMNQPVSMNLNPPFAISMVMVIGITILFIKYRETKSWKVALPLILLSGLLIEFKVYAGVIVLGALFIWSIQSFIVNRDLSYFKISIPSFIIAVILFFPQIDISSGFFEFKPFWFIHSMIDSPDRVGWMRLASARVNYQLAGNWPKFILAEILALMIFFIGNLGTRIVAFIPLNDIRNIKRINLEKYSFIFWMMIISFIIPLFLVQKGNPWNTIQFGYYFLYFTALFAGYSLSQLFKMKNKIIACLITSLVIIITPISSYTTFTFAYTNTPPARLTSGEYQALGYLYSQKAGVVLTPLFDKSLRSEYVNPFPLVVYDTTAYVSAFSGKPVYLEDENQQDILGSDYLTRKTNVQKFFTDSDLSWKETFLKENNIIYIYLPKLFRFSLTDIEKITRNIYENNDVVIYEYLK